MRDTFKMTLEIHINYLCGFHLLFVVVKNLLVFLQCSLYSLNQY